MALRDLVEARIRAAQAEGKLDHLAGAGKPLPRDVADDLPADDRFQVLLSRSVGHVPEEIPLMKEIAAIREELARGQGDERRLRERLADRQLRLSILHEANGRFLSASRVGR